MNDFEQNCRQMRNFLNVELERFAMKLNLHGKNILEVGIAGDEKPSGSYKFFGQGNKWTTLDINPKWNPDIVADITNNSLEDNSFDLVIMTQSIEHIWDFKKAISEIGRISKEYALIDSPLMLNFHDEGSKVNSNWEDWKDYWRITPAALIKLAKDSGFENITTSFTNLITIILCQKKS